MSLEDAAAALKTPDEVQAFLTALLSPTEYRYMKGRWKAFQLIRLGHSYRETIVMAGISNATVSRAVRLQGRDRNILENVLANAPDDAYGSRP